MLPQRESLLRYFTEQYIYYRKGTHMKVKNLKTRIAAFGLAVLMGVSTLSSANAFAAEQTDVGQEVQASEQAVTSQKEKAVTADDITKEISDETFAVETSMEGIHYDAEKEDVTLVSIQDEKGGEYHPDKAGTYIASYMVVPKDQSDSYTISRKVILTDTEGQAHAQDNGGEKQKSDTKSEDDSDSPVQNYTDVEIEASGEDASAQAVKELKEDIEEGNVMVLSAAERATSSGSTVTLTKGRTIYYPSYLGNYLTCLFTVNGKIAYCLQSQKASPPSGSYVAQVLDSNKNLQKVLYYGYGGAGDLTGSYLAGKTEDEKYVYTHIAASYAYAGEAGFTGCNYNDLVNAGVIAYINYLFGQEEPPKGELSLSSTKLNAVRDGNLQKTPNITLSGDHRNYVTLSVPENVTAHNLSKGTSDKWKDPDLWRRYLLSVDRSVADRQLCFRQLIRFCRKDMENAGTDDRRFQTGYRCIRKRNSSSGKLQRTVAEHDTY